MLRTPLNSTSLLLERELGINVKTDLMSLSELYRQYGLYDIARDVNILAQQKDSAHIEYFDSRVKTLESPNYLFGDGFPADDNPEADESCSQGNESKGNRSRHGQ